MLATFTEYVSHISVIRLTAEILSVNIFQITTLPDVPLKTDQRVTGLPQTCST